MIRILAAVFVLLVSGLIQAGQERPAPKKADIVKELERAFDEARARLQKDDPGEKTRAAHRRIIAGLDRLLEQEDDNSASPPAHPPAPNEGKQPKANKQPMPQENSTPEVRPTPESKPGLDPDGPWDPRRPRRQEALDAVGRERFPPRYEELLRAYYRSLAAGRGEEAP